jgi:hypothetical protein
VLAAHGFTVEEMVELIRAGLATATAHRPARWPAAEATSA